MSDYQLGATHLAILISTAFLLIIWHFTSFLLAMGLAILLFILLGSFFFWVEERRALRKGWEDRR